MAKLYTTYTLNNDDWDAIQRERLAEQQRLADIEQRYQQSQLEKAQSKPQGGLIGVLSGIGNSIANVGKSLYDIGGTTIANWRDVFAGKDIDSEDSETQKFRKSLYGGDNAKDRYAKSAGTALDAAATVSDLIPGMGTAAKIGLNVAQGAASGVAQNLIDNGANAKIEDSLRGALTGAVSSGVGQAVGGALARKAGAGNNALTKALTSNIGRGAITGAASGATGGALSTALNGGDLGQVLAGAGQGAQGGALSGGVMAGVTGLASKGLNKITNAIEQPKTIQQVQPDDARKIMAQAQTQDDGTQLIQKGTPEYDEMVRQDIIANRKRELQQAVIDGVRDQYGTVRLNDTIKGLDDAVLDMADLGLTKRADIDGFANRITGADGEVPKIIRKSLNDAGDVSNKLDITMDEIYRSSGANKQARGKIDSYLESQQAKYQVTPDGKMNRLDMYDLGKALEKEGYNQLAKYERTQNEVARGTGEGLVRLSESIIGKATDGVDISSNIDVNKLKNIKPGNEKWYARVDDFAQNAKTVQDARNFISNPTKMSLLAQAEKYNQGTYGQRVGDMGKDAAAAIRAASSANPAVAGAQIVATKAVTSDANKQRMINKALKNLADIEAGGTGGAKGIKGSTTSGLGSKVKAVGDKLGNLVGSVDTTLPSGNWQTGSSLGDTLANLDVMTPKEALNLPAIDSNAVNTGLIGLNNLLNNQNVLTRATARQTGLAEARGADNRMAAQEAQQVYDNATNDYNNATMARQAAYQNLNSSASSNPGLQQLNTISRAMELALNAGDFDSYNKLADLYQQAYKMYGSSATGTTGTQTAEKLTDNQTKALNGLKQLEQLSTMTPGTGTALANSPLGGLINMFGGDEYANQAQALALTLGYLQSGANVSKTEAENIGKSYIPTAYDSDAVRQQKLARAKELLNNYLYGTQYYQG